MWWIAISIAPCLAAYGLIRIVRRSDARWGRRRAELTRRWLASRFDRKRDVPREEGSTGELIPTQPELEDSEAPVYRSPTTRGTHRRGLSDSGVAQRLSSGSNLSDDVLGV